MKSIFYICGQCKSPLEEGKTFCVNCGRRVVYQNKGDREEKGKHLEMSWDKAQKAKGDLAGGVDAETSSEALKNAQEARRKEEERIARAKEEELKAKREETLRKAREEEAARKKALEEETARKKALEEETARKKALEEAARKEEQAKKDQAKKLTQSFKAAAAAKTVVPNTAAGFAPATAMTAKPPANTAVLNPVVSGVPMKRKEYVLKFGDDKTKKAFLVPGLHAIILGVSSLGILGSMGAIVLFWWLGAMLIASGYLLLSRYTAGMAKLYNVIMFVTMAISVGVFGYVAQMASIGLAAGLLLLSMLFKMKRIKAINQQYDQYARQITLGASAGDGYRIYTNPSYNFIVKSTDRWNQVSNVGPFDLKLYNATSDLYFYVMAYKKSEIKAGNLAKRVLELQLKDFQSKRNNVKELDPVAEIKTPDKTMYQTMFSAEKDGSVNHYYTRGIELLQGDEVLWVMANGQPDSIRNNLGEIKTMMDGITYKK